MGVPSFFRKLTQKYPHIIKSNPNKRIKALYIDANCLFHPQCFKVLDIYKNINNKNKLFKLMATRITKYIDYMIRLTNPTELVYIAVDGVAPLAKINQQRIRRFGYANNYKYDIYKKYNIPFNDSWSNIVITPGTDFMFKLHNYIKKYYIRKIALNKNTKYTYKILYNSYLIAGEGEHKILQHIKKYISRNNKDGILIYGLDADLVFLAMVSQYNNIYLLRESEQFQQHNSNNNESIEEELCYIDMDTVKYSINDDFNSIYNRFLNEQSPHNMFDVGSYETKQNKNNNFINDYIFICYFLGNDFLPHLPSIDIKVDGMEIIYDVYMKIFKLKGTNIINMKNNKVTIDNNFLLQFITMLASREENYFCNILPKYLQKQNNRKCFENIKYKQDIWKIENLKDIKINNPIKLGIGNANEWKYRYYLHYFNTDEYQQETINDICHNYIEGILWVTKYYFEECPNWRWQYRYTHAPFLSDIMMYLKNKHIMSDFNTIYCPPVSMYTQLVSVIPAKYSYILPKSLRHLNCSYESPIIDMFPTIYNIDMIYKTQLYKCIPIIPSIDVNRIIDCVSKLPLSNDEILRSKKSALLNLGSCIQNNID